MGVCDGLAKYMDKDSNLIRIMAVVLAVITGRSLAQDLFYLKENNSEIKISCVSKVYFKKH